MYGDLCPKLWTPQPNWRDMFVPGDFRPSLNRTICLHIGIGPNADPPDYVLVACLFLCSVIRICIRERFWSMSSGQSSPDGSQM